MRDRSFLSFSVLVLAALAAALAGSGCGRQLVGVAKPADLLAWEPQSTDPTARITAVSSTADWIYVGFSDGEMFFRANADGAAWAPYTTTQGGGCGAPIPPDTVTGFATCVKGLPADEQQTFVAFAGPPGSSKIWHSPPDRPCWATSLLDDDVYALSVSPVFSLDLMGVSPGYLWSSQQYNPFTPGVLPLDFNGTEQALASGVNGSGAARAWLGDDTGNIYYSDDVRGDADGGTTAAAINWTALPNPGFPPRPVVAIAIRPESPETIWVTFAGLYADSLWISTDNGANWHNPRGGEIGSVFQSPDSPAQDGALTGDAQAPEGASKASFGAVSPVPGLDAAYVTALIPDRKGVPVATTFWTLEGTDAWWRQ